jgi:GNAT superfamily N-acetyltransferase
MNPRGLHLRPATPAAAPAIAALISSLAHHFFASSDQAGTENFWASVTPDALTDFMARGDVIYLVGESNGDLCGAVCLRGLPQAPHLHHLFVASRFQGWGFGRQLWLAARDAAQCIGSSEDFTVNASLNAIGVYERFGFVAVGEIARANGLIFQPMRLPARAPTLS